MNDQSIERMIGNFVRHHRVELNITQEELSKSAGISRSTLALLEKGETVTLATLIRVLRVLNQLPTLESFNVEKVISPIMLAEMQKNTRYRASKSTKPKK